MSGIFWDVNDRQTFIHHTTQCNTVLTDSIFVCCYLENQRVNKVIVGISSGEFFKSKIMP